MADAHDAMTSRRSYRDVLPQATVAGEIRKGRAAQFDPLFADIMPDIIRADAGYEMRQK